MKYIFKREVLQIFFFVKVGSSRVTDTVCFYGTGVEFLKTVQRVNLSFRKKNIILEVKFYFLL